MSKKHKSMEKTRNSIERDLSMRGMSWESSVKHNFVIVRIKKREKTVGRAARCYRYDVGEDPKTRAIEALHAAYLHYCIEEGIEAPVGRESYK